MDIAHLSFQVVSAVESDSDLWAQANRRLLINTVVNYMYWDPFSDCDWCLLPKDKLVRKIVTIMVNILLKNAVKKKNEVVLSDKNEKNRAARKIRVLQK